MITEIQNPKFKTQNSPSRAKFKQLRAEIEARGWNRKPTARILAELGFHLTVVCGSMAVIIATDNWLLRGVALIINVAASMGVGTNAHTASHYATSERKWVNELLAWFGFSVFLQISISYWRRKHISGHHRAANVVSLDSDIDVAPWFALTESDFARGSRWRRAYYRWQFLLAPLMVGLGFFSFVFDGWWHLLGVLRDPARRRARHWADLCGLILHWLCWVIGPLIFFPAARVLAVFVVRFVLIGYAMFIVFAPNHMPAEAVFVDPRSDRRDFVRHQTETTLNYRTGWIGRLVCSGLQYQIEHHLFVSVSHVYYPQVSRLLEEFCLKHGYRYRTLGWRAGVWQALMAFRKFRNLETIL